MISEKFAQLSPAALNASASAVPSHVGAEPQAQSHPPGLTEAKKFFMCEICHPLIVLIRAD
jgi:hypothetical protein